MSARQPTIRLGALHGVPSSQWAQVHQHVDNIGLLVLSVDACDDLLLDTLRSTLVGDLSQLHDPRGWLHVADGGHTNVEQCC